MRSRTKFLVLLAEVGESSTQCQKYRYPLQIGSDNGPSYASCAVYDSADQVLYAFGHTSNSDLVDSPRIPQAQAAMYLKYDEKTNLINYLKVLAYPGVLNPNIVACNLSSDNKPIFAIYRPFSLGEINP